MGSALEIGIKFRKIVVISIRGCYRSVFNHPFLAAFLGFLFLLYRSFPFLFSVLVTASPVLVCTAVLLGTLLSFGQPNVPEIEREEEKVTRGISSVQTFSEGHTVVAARDESYFVKGYSENRSDDIEDSGLEEPSLLGERGNNNNNNNRDEEDSGLLSDAPQEEDFRGIQHEKEVNEGGGSEFCSFELGKRREVEENLRSEGVSSDEEAIEKQYVMVEKEIDDDILDSKNEEETLGDRGEFLASSSWKQVENNGSDDEDDDDGDESVESGSDEAESSSPDASMADIIPMLDELHPLLDLDAPQPAHLSRDAYDAASESSHKSDGDSVESDEYAEHGEGEGGGVDEHDDEEEEEMEGGKEDESKSAIKWTEDDQKNLMDLGTLELERNQRLENLIARRRARRMMNEKNLIDLDFSDIPSNVAPIATTRRNPFDFPDESDAAMGLPPIPGSAPSILQPRRNPFDIPYDSNEERPDLKRDSFQQEFSMFNQKEAFFRRHESFSLGPSVLGISKHERHDMNWKPIFVSERMASEGTSYSSFQRQSSEVSDSKLSSVPDTESVSSIDQDERKFSEQDLTQEAEIISNIDHVSDGVEHRSQSSGENDSVEMVQVEESTVRHDEAEIVLGGVENPSEMEFYPETGEVEIPEQFDSGETQLRAEPNDEESSSSSRSSHSSLSEVIDSIPDEKVEKEANLQQEDGHLVESRISTQTSGEESNYQHVRNEVEDNQHVDPVYDSSPPAAEKLQSFPSVSSDSATEFSERVLTPPSIEISATLADNESEVLDQRLEENSSGCEQTHVASSKLHMEIKNELRSEQSEDINQHNVPADEISAFASNFVDQSGSKMAEIRDVPVSEDSNLASDIGSLKGVTDSGSVHGQDLADHDSEIHLQDNVDSPDSNYQVASETSYLSDDKSVEEHAVPDEVSRFDNANMSESVQDAEEMLGSVGSDSHPSSNDLSMPVAHDLQLSVEAEQAPAVHPNLPSEDEVLLLRSAELGNPDIHQELDQNMVTFTSDSHHEIDVKSPSSLESCLSSSDKLVAALSSSDHDENQSSDVTQVETAAVIGTSNNGDGELHDAMYETPLNVSSVTSEVSETPEFGSPTGEVDLEVNRRGVEVENEDRNEAVEHLDASDESYTSQVTQESVKEFDDMKEIDEGFLSELDTVGDFSVNDASVSLHTDNIPEKMAEAEQEEIPVLEARSLEDINLAFKQLQEGVDVQEVILPSTIEDQLVSQESKDHHPEADSDRKVVEARYLEDIDVALEQILEGDQGEPSKPLDLSNGSVKTEVDEVGSAKVNESIDVAGSDLKVVQARSVEDIDITLKQISEGNQGNPSKPLDLSDGSVKTEVDEVGSAKVDESTDVADSDLKVVEARSQEDIDIALRQISEGNQGEPSKPSNLNDGSVKSEVDEVGSAKVAESIDVATSTEEVSKTPEEKLENAPVKSSGNKLKSHSRKSSLSSSDSD